MGIEKLGTVHVLGKDESDTLQIVAFCYDCARVMMDRRRRRPVERGDKTHPSGYAGSKVAQFTPRGRHGAGAEEVEPEAAASAVVEESILNLKAMRSNLERLAGLKTKTPLNLERLAEAVNELKSYTDRAHAIMSSDYSASRDCVPREKRLQLEP